ncbi:hypothetical protein AB833_26250 [Chromatiales bacterium (ex Bugula neritina AB1)]|nr:hypothetical protein AB833_26250 [Chromatiales bacterium (ex Bugula neritina AB1)]
MNVVESGTSTMGMHHAAVLSSSNQNSYHSARLFVEQQFRFFHGAEIECDYPALMTLYDSDHNVQAVAGIRSPDNRFFLEHYLDQPVEEKLSQLFQTRIRREKIVEVGSLAGGKDRQATDLLMHQLWDHLIRSGFEYLVVTGTKTLLFKFRKLPLHYLADANIGMVPDSASWGTYYDDSPGVVAGRLKDYDFRFFRNQAPDHYQTRILTGKDSYAI